MKVRLSFHVVLTVLVFAASVGCKARRPVTESNTASAVEDGDGAITMQGSKADALLQSIFAPIVTGEINLANNKAWSDGSDDSFTTEGVTALALQDPKTMTEEQRINLMLEQFKRETAAHREAIKANPGLEFKSVKCTQTYTKVRVSAPSGFSAGTPATETVTGRANYSVVVFFSTASEDQARSQCEVIIKSPTVREWFTHQYSSGWVSEGWVGQAVQFEQVRKHGFDLIEKDFPEIAKAKDGNVSFVTGFFRVNWFNCIDSGKGCRKTYSAAKSYCAKHNGRLAEHGDYLMMHEEIKSHEGYGENGDYFWIYDYAKILNSETLRKVFIRGLGYLTWREENEKRYLFCVGI